MCGGEKCEFDRSGSFNVTVRAARTITASRNYCGDAKGSVLSIEKMNVTLEMNDNAGFDEDLRSSILQPYKIERKVKGEGEQ